MGKGRERELVELQVRPCHLAVRDSESLLCVLLGDVWVEEDKLTGCFMMDVSPSAG